MLAQIQQERRDDPKFLHEFAQTKMELPRPLRWRDAAARRQLLNEAIPLLNRAIQFSTGEVRVAWCHFDLARVLNWLSEPVSQVEAAYLKAISLRPDEPAFRRAYERWKAAKRG